MKHATEWHGYNHRNVLFLVNPVSSKSFPAIRRLTHKKAPVVVTEALESLGTVISARVRSRIASWLGE